MIALGLFIVFYSLGPEALVNFDYLQKSVIDLDREQFSPVVRFNSDHFLQPCINTLILGVFDI